MAKKSKKSGGGGFLNKIGVKTKRAPTEDEKKQFERREALKTSWQFLREQIDKSIFEYMKTGDDSRLQRHVSRPILNAITDELDRLREHNIVWAQPNRDQKTSMELRVIDDTLDPNGMPTEYVIEERFRDYSIYRDISTREQSQADGKQKVIRAHVKIIDGKNYELTSVQEVVGATLEG